MQSSSSLQDPNTSAFWKQRGNLFFKAEDYTKAIANYFKGLEISPQDAILLSNSNPYSASAGYLELKQYKNALSYAVKSRTADPNYTKAYYREAKAHYMLGRFQEALVPVEVGLQMEPENAAFQELRDQILGKLNNSTEGDQQEFQSLEEWLLEGGALFPKLEMRYYSPDNRGVHSNTDIQPNEQIMFIPKSHIITLEMAKSTTIGQKMLNARIRLLSPKHCFLTTYVLQEMQNPNTFWRPYFNILPRYYLNFPIFYSDEELEWLSGSPFLNQVLEKIEDVNEDYQAICNIAPEFSQFSLEEFSKIRMAVSSRIFAIEIDGIATDTLVPLADMLNHKRPQQTNWYYNQESGGFIIESLEPIPLGAEVLDSYGKKCNSRFLLNYGFIVDDNDANEYPYMLKLDRSDPLFQQKFDRLKDAIVVVRVQKGEDHESFQKMCAYLRFILLEDEGILSSITEPPKQFPPISLENEIKALNYIKGASIDGLSKYMTNLDEDRFALQAKNLTENQRNCVKICMCEKEVLTFYLEYTTKVLEILDSGSKNFDEIQSNYVKNVLGPLVSQQI